jgi:hypothetical protein
MKPKHERVQELRNKLSEIRWEFEEIMNEDRLRLGGSVSPCVGGLSCVIIAACEAKDEMEKHYKKWGN